MTRFLHGQGRTRDSGTSLRGKMRLSVLFLFPHENKKMDGNEKKLLTVTSVYPMLAVVGRSWLSWIEQQATNLWVGSSNLSGRTTLTTGRLAEKQAFFVCFVL